MAKNNKLINSLCKVAARNRAEHVRMASERDVPQIYAAIAVAIWEMMKMPDEEKADVIEAIFARSQEVWEECLEAGIGVIEKCLEQTGIDIVGRQSEEGPHE